MVATINGLNVSISDMTDEQLMEKLRELRRSRRIPKRSSKRKSTKKLDPPVDPIKLAATLSPEMRAALIAQLSEE